MKLSYQEGMMDHKTLSALIGLIYDAALDVDLRPRLLRQLSVMLELQHPKARSSEVPDLDSTPVLDAPSALKGRYADNASCSPVPLAHRSLDTGLIDLFRSHFIRALELNREIVETRQERNALHDFFERLPLGMLITDSNSRVLTCNHKLNQVISDGKGLCIEDQRLCAMSWADTQKLRQLIRTVAEKKDHPGDTIRLHTPEKSLTVLVVPLKAGGLSNEMPARKVVLMVATPDGHAEISPEILRSLYQLTRAEARLVSALVKDRNLKTIAQEFGLSKNTLRTQLRAVYEKMGTHRQAELVRRVITGPAMLAPSSNTKHALHDKNSVSGRIAYAARTGSKRHQTMVLPDGRRLGFAEYGEPGGRPVMLMHAANGSRLERHPDETIIRRCGIRLIIADRPGIGLSDSRRHLTLSNWAHDVTCLADHLLLNRFNMIGYSYGAAFALACGYKLKERVGRIVTLNAMAPFDDIWELEGIFTPFRLLLFLGRYAHNLLEPMVRLLNSRFSLETYKKELFQSISPADQALISDDKIKNRILENLMETSRQGEPAAFRETFLVARPWGFELQKITIPVELWHGEQDRLFPIQLSLSLSKKLPNCRTRFIKDAGHYLPYQYWRQILLSAIADD